MRIITIDHFEPGIYEAVLRLLPQLDPFAQIPSPEYVKELIESENTSFFIAENDNHEISGMLTLVSCSIPTGRKFWIEDVVVDQNARGQGMGERLVISALNYARLIGAKEVRLTSRPSRVAANKLYQKMGFVKYETNVYKYDLF
jgi:ribosomal protein S18 acetylase RimI-like enzyme